MMAASSATVTVPADGPNRITEVKTNVSDTETVAGIDGSETVADPLRRVNRARTVQFHPMSPVAKSRVDWHTIAAPATTITDMYSFVGRGRLSKVLRVIKAERPWGYAHGQRLSCSLLR